MDRSKQLADLMRTVKRWAESVPGKRAIELAKLKKPKKTDGK